MSLVTVCMADIPTRPYKEPVRCERCGCRPMPVDPAKRWPEHLYCECSCAVCGQALEGKRAGAMFCSPRCRQRGHRQRAKDRAA